jgi:hypothetical protein
VRFHPGSFYIFPLLNTPFDRLVLLFQRARRLVDRVGTIYRALLASARLWMNWLTTRRHDTMPSVSLTSFKLPALRKVAERLQPGKRPESPNGSHVVMTTSLS